MSSVMRQKIIIIGNSFTTRLGLIWSVAQFGLDIVVVVVGHYRKRTKKSNPAKQIDCFSKYVKDVLYYNEDDGKEGLVKLILKECVNKEHKNIVIPSSDFTASAIDDYQSLLKDYFLFPHIKYQEGAISSWMNKNVQKNLAQETGLLTPNSVIVEIKNKKYNIPQGIKYPCFTKPLSSLNGGKKCVRRCNNRDELQEVLDNAAGYGIPNILVEDFISIDNEYAVLGFSNGKEVIIPGIIQFIKGSRSFPGIAMTGKVFPVKGYENLIENFTNFIREIGFVGIFDIDFFESNGVFYFGELNLRVGGSAYAITKMGVNLPSMFVRTMQGKSLEGMQQQIHGEADYVNERLCFLDWYNNYISTKEYKKIVNTADISFISDDNDLAPLQAYHKMIKKMYIKRFIKRIFRLV